MNYGANWLAEPFGCGCILPATLNGHLLSDNDKGEQIARKAMAICGVSIGASYAFLCVEGHGFSHLVGFSEAYYSTFFLFLSLLGIHFDYFCCAKYCTA